ncbi:hypothetical protein WJX72_011051 [[Myrmecia] bisecta]|uniref:Uncharacterized protein n=1 Tax=[Myrmecia] bisecta TaxID=41462 RepID=A0AAW1Q8P1_9CHLO
MSLEIEFAGEESILGLGCFQQAPFLELLSPVLTALRLPDLRFRLGEGELAALGQLRQLQELNIYVGSNGDTGAPETVKAADD